MEGKTVKIMVICVTGISLALVINMKAPLLKADQKINIKSHIFVSYGDEGLSVNAKNVQIGKLMGIVAEKSGIEIKVAEQIDKSLSVSFSKLSLEKGIHRILDSCQENNASVEFNKAKADEESEFSIKTISILPKEQFVVEKHVYETSRARAQQQYYSGMRFLRKNLAFRRTLEGAEELVLFDGSGKEKIISMERKRLIGITEDEFAILNNMGSERLEVLIYGWDGDVNDTLSYDGNYSDIRFYRGSIVALRQYDHVLFTAYDLKIHYRYREEKDHLQKNRLLVGVLEFGTDKLIIESIDQEGGLRILEVYGYNKGVTWEASYDLKHIVASYAAPSGKHLLVMDLNPEDVYRKYTVKMHHIEEGSRSEWDITNISRPIFLEREKMVVMQGKRTIDCFDFSGRKIWSRKENMKIGEGYLDKSGASTMVLFSKRSEWEKQNYLEIVDAKEGRSILTVPMRENESRLKGIVSFERMKKGEYLITMIDSKTEIKIESE